MTSTHINHIELLHHVIRYHNAKDTIKLEYVPTSQMIADMLTITKCLPKPSFA